MARDTIHRLFSQSKPITAAAVGVVSGFAATGVHQVYKQIKG